MAAQPKLRIGIIGAGNIGGTLTRRLTTLGHNVAVANSRGPESLAGLAAETGATAVTVNQAARGRDVVIVTIPLKNIPDLPTGLFDGASDKLVVVDTGNYYPRTARRPDRGHRGRIDGEPVGGATTRAPSRQGVQQHPRPALDGTRPACRHSRTHRLASGGQRLHRQGRRAAAHRRTRVRRRRRRGRERVLAATAGYPGLRHELRRRGRSSGPERGEPRTQAGVRATANSPGSFESQALRDWRSATKAALKNNFSNPSSMVKIACSSRAPATVTTVSLLNNL